MPTPHINASKGQIAETVLFSGDPLRAKLIAERFFEDVEQFNDVRNMFGFTGTYQGKRLSAMGHGMGIASIGIYAHELISEFGVKNIIRIGSCGSFQKKVKVRDIILAQAACTDSNFAAQFNLPGNYSPIADYDLLAHAVEQAEALKADYHVGNILTSDHFYDYDETAWQRWAAMGVLGVEMEAAGLYMVATKLKARALTMATVSDAFVTGERLSSADRQKSFNDMMAVALGVAKQL